MYRLVTKILVFTGLLLGNLQATYVRLDNSDDTYIRDEGIYVDYNYGVTADLEAGNDKIVGKFHKSRILIEFPYVADSLPDGATIDSAKLHINCTTNNLADSAEVYRVLQKWVEGTSNGAIEANTATWNEWGGGTGWGAAGCNLAVPDGDPAYEDSTWDRPYNPEAVTYIGSTGDFVFNIATAVQAWADTGYLSFGWANYGLMLKMATETGDGNMNEFSSEEQGDATEPYLEVWYQIVPPEITGLDDAAAAYADQYDSSNARFGFEVDDPNDDTVRVYMELERIGQGFISWDSLNGYVSAASDTGWLDTSTTTNDTMALNFRSMWGTDIETVCVARIITEDIRTNRDTVFSDTFVVDTKDPSGLTALTASDSAGGSVTLNWTQVTETNFGHYEIRYNTSAGITLATSDVWDDGNDVSLATKTTTTTAITGLSAGLDYYFKIWAYDSLGNYESVAERKVTLLAGPSVGWDNSGCVLALAPASWSRGNGTANQTSGEFSGYPDGSYNATLTNMTAGYGYLYNGGSGYINFDGVDDKIVTTGLSPVFTNSSRQSFEIKLTVTAQSQFECYFSQWDDASNMFNCAIRGDNKPQILFISGGTVRIAVGASALTDGQEYTLQFVKDADTLRIYANGQEVAYSQQDTYDLGNITLTQSLRIGYFDRGGSDAPFSNKLYWAAVYNSVLGNGRAAANALSDSTMYSIGRNSGDVMVLSSYVDARQYDPNFARIIYNVTDADDDFVTVTVEGKKPAAGGWTTWGGGFKSFAEWDTGSVASVPTAPDTIRWKMKSMLGSDIDTVYVIRVIGTDAAGSADTVLSDTFKIDTKNPSGLASFAAIGSTVTACSLAWDPSGLQETNFHHYEIWYGKILADVNSRGGTALEWDQNDDANLSSAAEDTAVIAGLDVGTKYYFRIWAVDSFSNEQTLTADSMSTQSSPLPVLKGWSGAGVLSAVQSDTSLVYIGYQVEDSDDANVTVTVELKEPDAAGWADWDSLNGYIYGDTGSVSVAAGVNDTMVLDLRAMWGDQVDTSIIIRVIADDQDAGTQNDTLYADTLIVDTKDPVGLGASGLSITAADTFSVTLSWSAISDESNFDHYEIWYDTLAGITRGAGEQEWDDGDDAVLATMATTSTEITGLLQKRRYYFRIWAVDSLGNDSTVTGVDTTTVNVAPVVTGWSDAANVGAVQTDTNFLRVRYEMDDFDDAQCTVRVEIKRIGEAGWTGWSTVAAYASGDTGIVGTSATIGRTAYLHLRNLWGDDEDTLALVRVIAKDTSHYADTTVSDTFVLDTKDPSGLANFVLKESTLTTLKAVWDTVVTEKNFDHYEIWFSTDKAEVLNRNGAAQEWDQTDDDTLDNRSADSTMVTGLTYNTLYYFKIWAYDSLGNDTSLAIDSLLTPTTAQASLNNTQAVNIQTNSGPLNPDESDYNYGSVATFGTGFANGGANDPNYRGLLRTADLSLLPQGATLDSAKLNVYCTAYSGTPDTIRLYRVIQNWIQGSAAGAEQVGSVTWNEYGGGASWYKIGCDSTIANAAADDGGEADRTVTPEASLELAAQNVWLTFPLTTAFQAWVDGYYGLSFGWDNNGVLIKQDDETTMNNNNTFASDNDATNPPYFDVWYRVVPPVLTGWDDAQYVDIEQYDTSSIRIGYKMMDENDDSVYVTVQIHKVGGTWVVWDSVDAFASGDTGWVDTSTNANDTILINVRNLLGDVDSLYEVRVIARDKRMNVDTLFSEVFDLDTKDPAGLTGFSATDSSETYITLHWTPPTESNFSSYHVRYDTVAGITDIDTLWDNTDDAALGTLSTNSTTITGLVPDKKYYFKIWASDTLGNEAVAGPESCRTLVGPVLSGWDDAVTVDAGQYDSSWVRIGFEVDDENEDSVHITAQYKKSSGGAWSVITNVTGDTGWTDTSETANDTILWNARAQLGVVDTFYLIRLIARDKDSLFDTLLTDTFCVDTKDPQNLTGFEPVSADTFAVTLGWTAPVETRFGRYEIRYDSTAGITLTDSLWTVADDSALGTLATSSATVSGLARRTTYYFKMWAYDSLGNVSVTQETMATTANIAPEVTGWADAAYINAEQIDSNLVRIGYELDDYDDAQGSIYVEIQMKSGAGWADWDSLNGYCTGDTGVVGTSSTANDTVLLDIRAMWGNSIDTLCLVRVIAKDALGAADTLASDTLVVDTKDPAGLNKVYPVTSDTFNITVRWDTVSADKNFDEYYLYYSAGSGVDRSDSLWGTAQDVRLDTAGTGTTTVTGLAGKTMYYFRLYAEDTLGNVSASSETSYVTANITPRLTGWGGTALANSAQYSNANVRLGFEVSDYDDDNATITLEGKKPAAGSWTPWATMRSFVYGDTGFTTTSVTANDTVIWKMKTQFGPGIDTFYVIRIMAEDTAGLRDSILTDTFAIDTKKPVGLAGLAGVDSSEVSVTMTWDTVTVENNFDHYELWYGTVMADVNSRNGSAAEWDGADDIRLDTAGTETTVITGLTINSKYYVKIWAVDQFGNDTTVALDSIFTLPSNVPVVRGWGGTAKIPAAMSDSSTLRIGYQVDDSDDGAVIVKYEIKKPAEAGWVSFDSLDVYTVAGSDTGTVTTSATANDTIWTDIRTLWGDQVETVLVVRVIGTDDAMPSNNADTTLSDTLVLDTKDPVWSNDTLRPSGNDTFSITLEWTGIPTETNFGHYEIWYDTLAGITRAAGEQEWNEGDDANLAIRATTTTTVTGLLAKRTYFFKIWAVDSLGNETALNETTFATADIAPELTGWTDAAYADARQFDSSQVRLGYELDDYDDASDSINVEMQMAGGAWMDWDSLNAYSWGDTGIVGTSATANDTVIFNARTVWGVSVETLVLARIIAKDTSGKTDSVWTDTFVVDTKDPVWSADTLRPSGNDTFSIFLEWTGIPAEKNFGHYEIWYDTLAGITRAAGEQEWDEGDDANLATKATTTTTITGLQTKRTYFFKVWAVDSLGNETALNETTYVTADIAPELTGWADNVYAQARQYDSSGVRLGYELDDYDDASDSIEVEMRMAGGSWMDWDSLNAYCSGDTGVVGTSSTANDTIIFNARAVWGVSVETLVLARIIARDTSGGADSVWTDSFIVDTKDPDWTGGVLAVSDSSGDRVTIGWDSVSVEKNFSYYEIWYDTSYGNAVGRTGTAQKYSISDNAAMAQKSTESVIITGLLDDEQYFFKIWAYDSLGNFTALQPESATTTTPSKRLNTIADAFIQDTVGFGGEEYSYNYGGVAYIRVGWRDALGAGANPVYRSLIKFTDIANVPSGATVDSAYLRLQCNQSTANDTVRIFRVLQDWTAGTANGSWQAGSVSWDSIGGGSAWNTIGAGATVANGTAVEDGSFDRTETAEAKAYVNGTGAYSWNITNAVSNWISGDWSNYGLLLKQDTESGADSVFNDFISGDGVGNTPYVDVYYRILEPELVGWNNTDTLSARQVDTSFAYIGYRLTDEEDSNAYISLQTRKKDGSWISWTTLKNHVSGDTGWTDTSSVINDTIVWRVRNHLGTGIETTYQARVIATDNKGNKDTLTSLNFVVDTKDPSGLGAFAATGAGQSSISLSWNAVAEKNFGHYEIYFDTVASVAQSDSVWDHTDDGNLAVRTTTATTVGGLLPNKQYYLKIWAVDSLGNRATVAEISKWTTVAPSLAGWGGSGTVVAGQYDSSMVRIGYEVDDSDGDSVHISVQYKKAAAGSWTALTNVTGDTGRIDTSSTANDTVLWNARAQVGVMDTFVLVRVIARDNDNLYDTLVSDTICLDTEDPAGLTNFRPTGNDTFSVTLQWTAPSESRFATYRIHYDTVASVNTSDDVWDSSDAAALKTLGTASATVTGLAGKHTYYFKMWAYDSLGNIAVSQETSYATPNITPDLTGWDGASYAEAAQYNANNVRIGFEAGDYDDDSVTVILEGKKPAAGGWTAWGALNTSMAGDTGRLASSATANDTVIWDMQSHLGNGIDTFYIIRAIGTDTAGDADTLYSDTFTVDTRAPIGLDTLGGIDSTATTVTLCWDTLTAENNFSHYEIWFDTVLANVVNRNGTAQEWDAGDAAPLGIAGTYSTVITGLTMNTKYYFKIWAVDLFGRESTAVTGAESVTTLPSLVPVLEGWNGISLVTAYQIDSSLIRIGYQVDDFDDAQNAVTMEIKKIGGSWTDWDSLNGYASGDTGLVNVSASVNDTIDLDIRAMWGGTVDTLYLVRVIASDGGNADTLLSDTFHIDTRDPAGGLAAAAPTDADTNSISVSWDKVTDEYCFRRYEVRYDTLAAVSLTDAVWDTADDAGLENINTTATTITGLLSKHRYYFRIWAVDSLGNRSVSNEADTITADIAPVVTGWSGATQIAALQYDSSMVRIGYELNDADDASDSIRLEIAWIDDAWISWDSLNAYCTGDTGAVGTSATANDTVLFNARTVWGDQVDSLFLARVIAVDTSGKADTTGSDTFAIDTKAPFGMANFTVTDTQANQITVTWDSVTQESHFSHYEIWLGTVKAGVVNRGTAIEWDDSDDPGMAQAGDTATVITGLLANTKYFIRIWALDALGNEMALSLDSIVTDVTNAGQLTGTMDALIQSAVGFGGEEDSMNYGNSAAFAVGWQDVPGFGDNPVYRSLIKFTDAESLPDGAIVDSAKMYLYCAQNETDDTVRVYRALQNWAEGTGTGIKQAGSVSWISARRGITVWNGGGASTTVANGSAVEDAGFDRTGAAEAKRYINATGWFAWDITDAVQAWSDGSWSNYGLLIKQDTETGADSVFNRFASSEAGSNHPYVDVWYRVTTIGTLHVSGTSVSPGSVPADSENVDMLRLTFVAERETIYFDSITVNLEGTGVDTGDLDTVALYADQGGAADTMIPGAYAFFDSAGNTAWAVLAPTTPLTVPRGETLRVHVVLDASGSASGSDQARIAILHADSIHARGNQSNGSVVRKGTFPIKSGDMSLPVEFASFTADLTGNAAKINWRTESETDNLGYYVYRSARERGIYTQLTGELIPGAGYSETGCSYTYTDRTVEPGNTYWYKIADVSFDGAYTYHGPVRFAYPAVGADQEKAVALYPNPFHNAVTISFGAVFTPDATLTIYSLKGETVVFFTAGSLGGGTVTWDGRTEAGTDADAGTYIAVLRTDRRVIRKRILKAR